MKIKNLNEAQIPYTAKTNFGIRMIAEPLIRKKLNISTENMIVHHFDRDTAKIDKHEIDLNNIVILVPQIGEDGTNYTARNIHDYISYQVENRGTVKALRKKNEDIEKLRAIQIQVSIKDDKMTIEDVIKNSK